MISPSETRYAVDVRTAENGRDLALVVEVPRRWWQVWRPRLVTVPLRRGQVILLYQTLHKHATKAMIGLE